MNTWNSPARRPALRAVAVFAAVLVALVLGAAGPALANTVGGPDDGRAHAGDRGNSATNNANADDAENRSDNGNANPAESGDGNGNGNGNGHRPATDDHGAPSPGADDIVSPSGSGNRGTGRGPDHSQGNAGTTGDAGQAQPTSNADQNAGGANGQCPGGAYCSTRDGSASANGNGNGTGKGKPCAGCVGQADNKNPHGQRPNGTDHNAGYECDRNHGVGRGNPAHTGCATPESPTCPAGTTTQNGQCVITDPPRTCPTGTSTQNGQCVITDPPRTCPAGTSTQSGACVTPPETCPGRTSMVDGHCVAPPKTCGADATLDHGACVVTSPPTCTGDSAGTTSSAGGCTSAPTEAVDAAAHPHASPPVPQAASSVADTVGPTAPTGDLPNTGAPAGTLVLLLGGLALLGGGAWVVRRQFS